MSLDLPPDSAAPSDENFQTALTLCQSGQFHLAQAKLEEVLRANPQHADALHQLGLVQAASRNFKAAELSLQTAIALRPTEATYRSNLGNVLQDLQRPAEAVAQYDQALALQPSFAEAYFNRGLAQQKLLQHELAISSFTQAIALRPQWDEPVLNRGNSFLFLLKHDDAIADYTQAITLNPAAALAYINRGILLFKQKRLQAGFDSFLEGLRLDPQNAAAFRNFAEMLAQAGDCVSSAQAFLQAYELSPSDNFSLGSCIHQKALVADWSKLDLLWQAHRVRLGRREAVAEPFGFMGFAESETEALAAAQIFSAAKYPLQASPSKAFPRHRKIRIGYLGGEFRAQATAYLLTGMLEAHDKGRFEVVAFDSGWDDGSEIRKRQMAVFDEVVRIDELSDAAAAALIRKHEIDILIDLNGFFGNARQGVLARRPGPVQVSYLGCPGTMGTPYMDYLIADQTVVPRESEPLYLEKIVRMPWCYQCNDNQREISGKNFSRADWGLPATGFVFCCFNNIYKILPATFDRWVRILKQVEGSVLWLFESHPVAVENLRKEALARGLDPARIIFAKHVPLPEHLARHRLADLFLDTLPYNAHTTASDALWAGLPVLTLTGRTFPGRVATSLLKAINMPELVATTPDEYEAMAIDLSRRPEKLVALKIKLANNRLTTPLFNTQLYTRHFEAALIAMYERSQAGLPPDYIEIKA